MFGKVDTTETYHLCTDSKPPARQDCNIQDEAKKKGLPVVVSMGGLAASGGYWVSTPADVIFAEPGTITGSIGIFGIIPTFETALAKIGVTTDGVKTTPLSGQPDITAGTTPMFDTLIQAGIENGYRQFIARVAASRKLSPARVDAIGQGRVWDGGTARQVEIVTGQQQDGLVEVVSGLAPSARIIVTNLHRLSEGSVIEPVAQDRRVQAEPLPAAAPAPSEGGG